MKTPLVSVIVPTYNEEKNIGRLLNSIKKQTYSKIESIVVDDSSEDGTVEKAKKLADRVYCREHAERSVQRNFGVSKSKGKYLVILDADMELTKRVIEDCVKTISASEYKALIIPEKTMGKGFIARARRFEREMYLGDPDIEVARFFEKSVFLEFGGYDENLTGAEDYDLPKRISEKYSIGWAKEFILHHEAELTLWQLLRKKYYYASRSVAYADKHPDLVWKQGTIILRRAYLRHWRKFVSKPLLGLGFIGIRLMVTVAAVAGYIRVAGVRKFVETFFRMFKR